MAVQLHVAYSGTFQGVGAIAGGPYYCAENLPPSLIDTIKLRCMNGFIPPSAAPFIHEAKAAAAAGEIDNLSNLADDKVLIFNSATDQVINPGFSFVQYLFEFLYDDDAVNEAVKPSPGSLLKLSQLDYVDDPNITTVAELKAHGIGEYAYA